MKIKPEYIFGGISALAGIGVLYFASKNSGPAQNNYYPPLTTPDSQVPTVAANGSVPAIEVEPYQTVPVLQAPAQQVPYQVRNFGPRHVERKAQQQAVSAAAQSPVTPCSCGGNDTCARANANAPAQVTTIPPNTLLSMYQNMQTVGTTPQPPSTVKPNPPLYSAAAQFNDAVAAQAQVVAQTNQGGSPVANVPSASENGWVM